MPETKRPLKVFLCHAHADRDAVRALYNRLVKDGVDAWLDKEKLLGGADWEYEIRKAVRESDVVIVCHSQQFNQRGFRQKEVKIALEEADLLPKGEIFIIPVRLEECDVLDDLKRWHWVDLFEGDGYERLMRALRARAEKIGAALQVKKNWLPKVSATTPRIESKKNKGIEEKVEPSTSTLSSEENPLVWESKSRSLPVYKKYEKQSAGQVVSSGGSRPSNRLNVSAPVWIFVVILLSLMVLGSFAPKFFSPTSTQTSIPTATAPKLPTSTMTLTAFPPSKTPTILPTITFTPLPTEIVDDSGAQMLLVPAGEFVMGSDTGRKNEGPSHRVYLDAFYVDKYEVTNKLYSLCVRAGFCDLAGNEDWNEPKNYPVWGVDWYNASAYCAWVGERLPTEAEWEKAARGTDARTYPWGEEIDCNYVDYIWPGHYCKATVQAVGSYKLNISPYGLFDMSGNVSEWVSDWYSDSYYAVSPFKNPTGPSSGSERVLRGGQFGQDAVYLTTFSRSPSDPSGIYHANGFRCARSIP